MCIRAAGKNIQKVISFGGNILIFLQIYPVNTLFREPETGIIAEGYCMLCGFYHQWEVQYVQLMCTPSKPVSSNSML